MARSDIFVTSDWLAGQGQRANLVVLDGSYYLSTMNRDAAAEYLAAHIPGALRFDIDEVKDASSNLPHMMPSPDVFAAAAGAMGIADTDTIVVYDGIGLFSAPRVRWMFRSFGAANVRILEGGLPKWLAEGRPVEAGKAPTRAPKVFRATFDPQAVASRADVKAALASSSHQVLDARPAGRFAGKDPEPRPNLPSGHMPGSLNLPFASVIENGSLKDEAALRAAFAAAGIDPAKPVITSCGSGVSAAILGTALELIGHPAEKLYDGSWAEWASHRDAAIATT
jgi:thiosulfate/3-mercaptopyruvate sulfurtransferase